MAAQDIKAGGTNDWRRETKRKLLVIECQRFQVLERAQTLQVTREVRPRGKGVEQGV